jgi:hypothetical protein
MNKERKNLEALIEANYQNYKLLQKQLNETNNFAASMQLREIYFEINRLRFDEGAEMIKDVYNI